ncbi:MAG TPA: hypothetical protein VHS96_08040 [Bacteroidia bacterium]|nr:hypothetical protein [Bacteroidia bacterium]
MKPFSIVLTINIAFFAIWGLFFGLVVNRPELIPLFTSVQAAFNLLGAGVFFLDRKKEITRAFLMGLVMVVAVTIGGYLLLKKYRHLIGLEEGYTAQVECLSVPADRA